MLLILGALSVFVLLPSGFLVINTISALLTQQIRQIGIMKAIGARTYQVAGIYLAVAAIFGLLSLAIPLPLAALAARAFSGYMAGIFFDLTTFSFPPHFLLVLAVLLAAVGGLGLMGTMSLNVLERTREIGVMRAIGASDGAVLLIVMVESILTGVLSRVGGVALGFPIGRIIRGQTGIQLFQTPCTCVFAPDGIFIWLVVVIVLSALASFLPARSATRLTVREVLAYE